MLEVSFFSEESQSPHQVSVQEGQPQILECGSIISVPPVSVDWEIFADLDIDPRTEFAIAGLDGRLYLQSPMQLLNEFIFECSVLNRETETNKHGYIQVTVEGLCLQHAEENIMIMLCNISLVPSLYCQLHFFLTCKKKMTVETGYEATLILHCSFILIQLPLPPSFPPRVHFYSCPSLPILRSPRRDGQRGRLPLLRMHHGRIVSAASA